MFRIVRGKVDVQRDWCRVAKAVICTALCGCVLTARLAAQTLLVANPTVIRANFSVVFNPQSSTSIVALQFTLTAQPGQLTSLVPTPGSAAVAAGDQIQCSPLDLTTASTTCLVFGVQPPTVIGAGTVVNFSATVAPNTLLQNIQFTLTGIVASDAMGNSVPINTAFPAPPFRFADNEVPSGAVDGVNQTFKLLHAPVSNSLLLFRNGLKQTMGVDFTLAGGTIMYTTLSSGAIVPTMGDILTCSYRY